ncbi:MAG: cadmium-translocating P-type ATPase [Oscillospiraceae bacterium]|nr:cadmium-translocating P-type ATPase [Oscillospiraceae bacterium]
MEYEQEHHHHTDDCCCGHEHEHEHDDDCCCGHDHDHDDDCCGHDHEHEHGHRAQPEQPRKHRKGGTEKRVYVLEGLDCPNCAAKIEQKIREMPEVEDASLVYPTRQLQVTAAGQDELLPAITALVQSVEPEVQVIPYSRPDADSRRAAAEADKREMRQNIAVILTGAVILIGGSLLHHGGVLSDTVFLIVMLCGYLICGGEVIWEAFQNICRGQVFDENFLMSVATIGAFATGEYPEALGVMLFYRVGELFEQIATERSRSQIMDAVDLRPEVVNLVREDAIQVLPAENAAVGDILLVRPGDRIPLDGVVIEGDSFLDTSAITGEPVPVRVSVDSPVTSGCVNQNGVLKIRVEKPLEDSMVSRIMDAVENAAASKPTIDKFITRFCRVYTPFVCALALFTAIVPSLVTGNWDYWVYTALTFLVISCPCALVLSVPLAFFCGIGKGSKYNILFKGGAALESLCNIRAIALDKTGTITKGSFQVQRCAVVNGMAEDELLTLAAACESASSHPIGQSIVFTARERGLAVRTPEVLEETAGSGIRAMLDGREVLCGNRRLMAAHGIDLSAAPAETGTEVLIAIDGVYAGTIIIDDEVKSDAKEAVEQLHAMGVTTAMLTGDAQASADRVAREVGIDQVHAKLLPEQKFDALRSIREESGSVMFVGDGINDAPVLAGADVGAAMGTGADAAIEAADVVFMTGELSAIPRAIRIARDTNRIARQNVVIALVIKFGIMALGLLGHANMWTAVFADTGVSMICILNSIRILYSRR